MEGRAATDLARAFGFLTVLPTPEGVWKRPGPFGRSFSWFPLVGLVLGGLSAVAALGLGAVLPAGVVAALVVALGVALTGGIHLDGLMDSCDGLLCAKTPEERLAVMRDSRVGAFGVLGATCVLLSKYAALSALLAAGAGALAALLLAPALGRWAMVFAAVSFPYGRAGGSLGSAFVRGAGPRQLVLASATVLVAAAGLCLWSGTAAPVAALAAALVVAWALCRFALSRLPGLTGDVYGGVGEVVEVAVLVVFAGWLA